MLVNSSFVDEIDTNKFCPAKFTSAILVPTILSPCIQMRPFIHDVRVALRDSLVKYDLKYA